jgi:hypothetical protein
MTYGNTASRSQHKNILKKRYVEEEKSHRVATRGSTTTNCVPVSLIIKGKYRNTRNEKRTKHHITDEQM